MLRSCHTHLRPVVSAHSALNDFNHRAIVGEAKDQIGSPRHLTKDIARQPLEVRDESINLGVRQHAGGTPFLLEPPFADDGEVGRGQKDQPVDPVKQPTLHRARERGVDMAAPAAAGVVVALQTVDRGIKIRTAMSGTKYGHSGGMQT
jgi:hypothetical protein